MAGLPLPARWKRRPHAPASLGVRRGQGMAELAGYGLLAVLVAAVSARGGSEGYLLGGVLVAALVPYLLRGWRIASGAGQLRADPVAGGFTLGGDVLVRFDELAALHTRMVNAGCGEFQLVAETRDGGRQVLYEGAPTNAAWRSVEQMARLAGVPHHHRL